jgi:predicted amidohydrolase
MAAAESNATVRVAAVQCPSVMGNTKDNLVNIMKLAREAAAGGARIVVFPECALQGYMEPTTWTSWSRNAADKFAVQKAAEKVPGKSTGELGRLADELDIYLCVGLIEAGTNGYFNAQVLLGPDGSIMAHHRKKLLWTPGDSTWCSPGRLPVQCVDTEYGRLGLMICYDFHRLPALLAKQNADIVLYSVGWYGPNEKNWFSNLFPQRAVVPYNFDIVVANWSAIDSAQVWPGRGYICVINRRGRVLSMASTVYGNEIVFADIPIRQHALTKSGGSGKRHP